MKQKLIIFTVLLALIAACSGAVPALDAPQTQVSSEETASPAESVSGGVEQDIDPVASPSALPDYGPAPEISGDTWLNADAPLRLEDLRGRVVLIDMWTFG